MRHGKSRRCWGSRHGWSMPKPCQNSKQQPIIYLILAVWSPPDTPTASAKNSALTSNAAFASVYQWIKSRLCNSATARCRCMSWIPSFLIHSFKGWWCKVVAVNFNGPTGGTTSSDRLGTSTRVYGSKPRQYVVIENRSHYQLVQAAVLRSPPHPNHQAFCSAET